MNETQTPASPHDDPHGPPADVQRAPNDAFAARLRGLGPIGLLAILLVLFAGNIHILNFMVPIGALLVVAWVHLSHTPWRDIGYTRPPNWLITIATGIAVGVALKFALKAVIMPLLGAEPINRAYAHLTGNPELIPAALWTMAIVGLAEETVFRGFLFERLGKLLGEGRGATVAIVLLTSAVFALAHYPNQGWHGVQNSMVTGLVFGSIYAATRSLWVPIIAHSAFDLTAYAIIYWNLEARVAYFFFD